MNVQKAQWTTDGNTVRVTMPLQKVDIEKRIVSGYATLDNIDTSDDVVLASASQEAFANFRGNIRLMHQPIPAGKLVDFREDSYYDAKTQKFYNGIYVDVYISKGAPNIWEMCLDGTLTGFSIGGQVTDHETQFVKDAGKAVRFIKAYQLIELSLVDSPANQLCDIFSIQKSADGSTSVHGMATEVVAENVFWCKKDEVAFVSSNETKDCSVCNVPAENIGWFESDGGDKTEKVNAIVAGFVKTDTVEGRETIMADETTNVEKAAEAVEVEVQADPTPLVVEGDASEEEVVAEIEELTEENEDVSNGEDDDDDEVAKAAKKDDPDADGDDDSADSADDEDKKDDKFGKMFSELADSFKKSLEESADATQAELVAVNDKLAALGSVADKLDELAARHAELEKKFDDVSSKVESVEKAFDAVEKGVGIKKSGDLGGSTGDKLEKSSKSLWGGRFFGSVENI